MHTNLSRLSPSSPPSSAFLRRTAMAAAPLARSSSPAQRPPTALALLCFLLAQLCSPPAPPTEQAQPWSLPQPQFSSPAPSATALVLLQFTPDSASTTFPRHRAATLPLPRLVLMPSPRPSASTTAPSPRRSPFSTFMFQVRAASVQLLQKISPTFACTPLLSPVSRINV